MAKLYALVRKEFRILTGLPEFSCWSISEDDLEMKARNAYINWIRVQKPGTTETFSKYMSNYEKTKVSIDNID